MNITHLSSITSKISNFILIFFLYHNLSIAYGQRGYPKRVSIDEECYNNVRIGGACYGIRTQDKEICRSYFEKCTRRGYCGEGSDYRYYCTPTVWKAGPKNDHIKAIARTTSRPYYNILSTMENNISPTESTQTSYDNIVSAMEKSTTTSPITNSPTTFNPVSTKKPSTSPNILTTYKVKSKHFEDTPNLSDNGTTIARENGIILGILCTLVIIAVLISITIICCGSRHPNLYHRANDGQNVV